MILLRNFLTPKPYTQYSKEFDYLKNISYICKDVGGASLSFGSKKGENVARLR